MADTQANINYPVHLGVWTNWSLGGRITGSVITLTHYHGALLTAFLAIFVTFVGSRFWRIACFIAHQLLSESDTSQDGLYHQRQTILRNASDEKSGFLNLCRILKTWRQRAHRPFSRMLPIIGLSFLIIAGFTAGSILSSRIASSMGNEVLVSSQDCGFYNATSNATASQEEEIFNPWISAKITSYANYAQKCYSDSLETDSTETARENCGPYIKRKISSTVNRNSTCPFDAKVCRDKFTNIEIDTGYIDSLADIGLNTPDYLRFMLRKTLQCAVLKNQGYEKVKFYSQDKPYMQYFYGHTIGSGSNISKSEPFTHEAEVQSANEVGWQNSHGPYADYRLFTTACYTYNGACDSYSTFVPIRELAQADGDVTLIFLSANGIRYQKPVNDKWYAAHRNGTSELSYHESVGSIPYYLSDEPASVIGCKEQTQTCDPRNLPPKQGCTPLGGEDSVLFAYATPKTRRDMSIYWGAPIPVLSDMLNTLQSSGLTARFTLSQGILSSLPEDQWQREVENWHNIRMASIQGMSVDFAMGSGNTKIQKYFWTKPSNDVERYLCKSQKIVSTAYTNFSAMWLFIVLIIGTMIILFEFSLETVAVWLESRGFIKTSSIEWFGNHNLQLQRMAHEELGLGEWEGFRDIPVTKKGQLLGVFSTADPAHPRLVNPNATAEKPNGTANIDDPDSQPTAATSDGSETEINGDLPGTSQNDGQNGSIISGAHDSLIEHQENGHISGDQTSSSHSQTDQGNNQPQSLATSPLDGQAVTQSHLANQHSTTPNDSPAISPISPPTGPDVSFVHWPESTDTGSGV